MLPEPAHQDEQDPDAALAQLPRLELGLEARQCAISHGEPAADISIQEPIPDLPPDSLPLP